MAYNNNDIKANVAEDDEITIDLAELFSVVWKKMPVIILSVILCAAIALGVTKFMMTPMYVAETKVYVLNNSNNDTGVTTGDLQVGTYLTKDYMELVKSRPVLEYAIKKLNLDTTPAALGKIISVSSPADTRILSIKVEHESPELASDIANAVREQAGKQICEIMKADAVNVVEEAEVPTKPSSPSKGKNTVLGGLLGGILVVGFLVVKYLLDDTIKTAADVDKYLGLTTLTSIPIMDGETKSKKKNKQTKSKSAKKGA